MYTVHVNYYLLLSTFISLPGCGDYQTGNEIDRGDLVDPMGPLNSTLETIACFSDFASGTRKS